MAVQFSCPECDKVLKSANPIAPGKKVKCPSCGTVFAPAVKPAAPKMTSAEETVELPRTKPAAQGKSTKPEPFAEDDEQPAAKPKGVQARKPAPKPAVDVDDDDDEPPLNVKKKRRPRDESEDDEERPRRRAKKKSSAGLFIILGLVVVVLGLGAVAAFIWPGFLKSDTGPRPIAKGKEKVLAPEEDLWTYVPKDSATVVGLNLGALRASKVAVGLVAQVKAMAPAAVPKGGDAKKLEALLDGIDQLLICELPGDPKNKRSLAVALFSADIDLDALKAALAAKDVPRTMYMQSGDLFLASPSGKILMFGVLPQPEFTRLAGELGKEDRIPPDLKAQIEKMKDALVWLAQPTTPAATKQVEDALAPFTLFDPKLKAAIDGLKKSKASGLEAREDGANVHIKARIECQDAKDAQAVQEGLSNAVKTVLPFVLGGLDKKDAKGGGLPPEAAKTIRAIADTFKGGANGTEAWLGLTISQAQMNTLQALATDWLARGGP